MPSDDVVREFTRIDPIRSVSEMMAEVAALPEEQRRAVILHALAQSRFQCVWSFLAGEHGVPRSDWPPNPHETPPNPHETP